jgi:hypothetical protein
LRRPVIAVDAHYAFFLLTFARALRYLSRDLRPKPRFYRATGSRPAPLRGAYNQDRAREGS